LVSRAFLRWGKNKDEEFSTTGAAHLRPHRSITAAYKRCQFLAVAGATLLDAEKHDLDYDWRTT
jgi:hypothetical protein